MAQRSSEGSPPTLPARRPPTSRGKISFDGMLKSMPSPRIKQDVKPLIAFGYLLLVVVALLALCRPVKKKVTARPPAASPTAAPAAAELQSKGELTEADVANLKAEAQQEVKKDR